MDITVVTAAAGNRDSLQGQPIYDGVQYIAFADLYAHFLWEIRKVCTKFASPIMNAKIHKILTHKYIDSKVIVWMDASMQLLVDPHELLPFVEHNDFAFFKHHARGCLYKEIDVCLKLKKGNPEELIRQRDYYKANGFPEKAGMAECGAFIRLNTAHANAVFERWWVEICRFSDRDQISFPVAFWGERFGVIPGMLWENNNSYFAYKSHNGR